MATGKTYFYLVSRGSWYPNKSVSMQWEPRRRDLLADALMMVMGSLLTLPPANLITCTPILLANLIFSYLSFHAKPSLKAFLLLPRPPEVFPMIFLSCFPLSVSTSTCSFTAYFSNNCYLSLPIPALDEPEWCRGRRVETQPRDCFSEHKWETQTPTINTQLTHVSFPFQLLDRWAFCCHALSCTRELLGKFDGPEMQTDGLPVGFEDPGVTVMCSQGLFAF